VNAQAEQARKAVPESCFRCGSGLVSAALCFDCEAVQPLPPSADYFQLFGMRRAYAIDPAALERTYEKLSFALHPDFQDALDTGGPAAPRQVELQRLAAQINEGYRTLRDESARGAYLLSLLAAGRELDKRQLPPGFLQQMFVLQEQVDELGEQGPAEARRPLREAVEQRRRETLAERARLFAALGEAPGAAQVQAIQSNLNQEKYLLRLLERLGE
jgi:molecular chaperone HscB